jgi:hypothetical protein
MSRFAWSGRKANLPMIPTLDSTTKATNKAIWLQQSCRTWPRQSHALDVSCLRPVFSRASSVRFPDNCGQEKQVHKVKDYADGCVSHGPCSGTVLFLNLAPIAQFLLKFKAN